ncbi:MAG: alpha/beta fold hydrolase [Caulobacteraceae bacterium]|nr:alpha/beta fold hydrolase [Caulobacteraceae bacterium]
MPTLIRDGVELYYETHGQGTPVLLTHGYAATSQMWRGQVAPLTGAGYQLIAWDMRGHGRSEYPAEQGAYSREATVADMAAILDAVGATRAVIGGLSLGGYMSMAFYALHPERTLGLLIFDTGPGYRNAKAREDWNVYANDAADRYQAEGLARLAAGSAEAQMAEHRSADGLVKAARGMLTQHDALVMDTLPDVKVPALVLVGADDARYLTATDYMAAKIPGAKKAVIANAGHGANIDQPEAFNRAVLDFLKGAGL